MFQEIPAGSNKVVSEHSFGFCTGMTYIPLQKLQLHVAHAAYGKLAHLLWPVDHMVLMGMGHITLFGQVNMVLIVVGGIIGDPDGYIIGIGDLIAFYPTDGVELQQRVFHNAETFQYMHH